MKIGLLPLYLELYDRSWRQIRPAMDAFHRTIVDEFRRRGVDVVTTPLCRVKKEFNNAVAGFEKSGAEAIVTLHLAYSPSLESSEALTRTRLPVIVFDTTPSFDFGPGQAPGELVNNHGIHGVQDMCSLFVRAGVPFLIEAGHWKKSDVFDRVMRRLKSARAVTGMRTARIGTIGGPFEGMGDFAVPASILRKTIGCEVVPVLPGEMRALVNGVSESEIAAEMAHDRRYFDVRGLSPAVHRRTALTSLAVRRWIEKKSLDGFTMNFLAVTRKSGMPTVPFLEAGKAMARGLGYAGEGDVLTAALVGALARAFTDVSFTEMFCPDWKANSVMLSHMGEVNPRLLVGGGKLDEYDFVFTDADNPARIVGRFRPGRAVFVNLVPLAGWKYRLIVAPCEMLTVKGTDRMKGMIRGWMRPGMDIARFLEQYSRNGGTHHAALVYGDCVEEIRGFGELMNWETVVIE